MRRGSARRVCVEETPPRLASGWQTGALNEQNGEKKTDSQSEIVGKSEFCVSGGGI